MARPSQGIVGGRSVPPEGFGAFVLHMVGRQADVAQHVVVKPDQRVPAAATGIPIRQHKRDRNQQARQRRQAGGQGAGKGAGRHGADPFVLIQSRDYSIG